MLKVFSSKSYSSNSSNYGDCFLFIEGKTAVVYDCGSEEHAKRVIAELDNANISKAIVILSHNDDDHFKGIPYLIEQGYVDDLFTVLLLKYKQELLDEIDDGRKTKSSIGDQIKEMYDNIASLSGKVKLHDIYQESAQLPSVVKFVGPEKDYMIKAAAKGLDTREGDRIDGETITNATSIQIELDLGKCSVLLTGDSSSSSIPDGTRFSKYKYIQLPHHGKLETAEELFKRVYPHNCTYIVSDNTGNTNGGSDKLVEKQKGKNIKNTINGNIVLPEKTDLYTPSSTGRCLGVLIV